MPQHPSPCPPSFTSSIARERDGRRNCPAFVATQLGNDLPQRSVPALLCRHQAKGVVRGTVLGADDLEPEAVEVRQWSVPWRLGRELLPWIGSWGKAEFGVIAALAGHWNLAL